MFNKFLVLMVAVAIFAVQADTTTNNGLKAAFDEMNFALNVEWDQRDHSFYDAQMKKFNDKVLELQKQGLTNEEMIEFAKTQVKDTKIAKDLETAFSVITLNKMSTQEATKYMMESMKRSYSHGATWTSSSNNNRTYLIVGLLVVAIAIAIVKHHKEKKDTPTHNDTPDCSNNCECLEYDPYQQYCYYNQCSDYCAE